ncbi:MAG: hypothetical protein GEU95_04130 [Rhizobiales bacterium]|nr:hypothetical protein [Hyphomicrobiales bacterium]
MTAITDVIDDIAFARRLKEKAIDELERMEAYGPTCDAASALNTAELAERYAFRELASVPATSAEDIIAKCILLINATTGDNLGEPIWEAELQALKGSIDSDIASLGAR